MSAFNPFRARNVDGVSTLGNSSPSPSPSQPEINLPPDLFTKPPASQLPNGYPRKSALSLEIEDHESSSSSSDDQTADPFNPDSAVSDNEDDERNDEHSRSFASPTDHHSRDPLGSAPHPAPSEEGSTTGPPLKTPSTQVSTTEAGGPNAAQGITPSLPQSAVYKSPENDGNTSSSSRADKEKKPPPPPRSHHGKRINSSHSTSRPESSRSTNRLSFHASSPESVTSVPPPDTPNANAGSPPPASDYFLTPSDNQQTSGSTDSLQRSHSQSKRPPTPPLSRRHSQMRRSKSTQSNSKSSTSRLTMSSIDSESNDSSQPPSPGPSTRSVTSSMSQDRKRVSMPPPAPGDTRAAAAGGAAALPASGTPADSISPPPSAPSSRPTPLQPGRRTSSYGSPATGSSFGAPPPPPPPRRARDSILRASDGGAEPQASRPETPLPQPSNATDILADLSRLQKEVDDLRGHYESRKVSQ
ncbi:hypothetical protein N7481_012301 [Penicillium waksmanii]|uniref:uncharacterized protein n=1 Tax=Penicillium waksmanii TaxID=69791 RepID=UPI0025471806|nr:uncharacterized protein N7481_012301 [Penicillium waksmanii]KAJ5965587.1 hypothetical protein N7481_012301 [Penicillium waksmanii]